MTEQQYRVFVCYAHENTRELEVVVNHLRDLNVMPCSSSTLHAGSPFPHQIKENISRSHLFLPILTREAHERPWVHQEIGFALAANVPVLPLAVGELPTGLAEELQAIQVSDNLEQLKQDLGARLSYDDIESAVLLGSSGSSALFEVAPLHEDRTRMLISSTRWLLENRKEARVRQWGSFTSFSLPDVPYSNCIWEKCDGEGAVRSWGLRRDLQLERQMLERLALRCGCDLIIDPNTPYSTRGKAAKRVRLEILVDFLRKSNVKDIRAVVLSSEVKVHPGNLLLLGDWFLAESITPSPGMGYLQTLGTWHAPTVMTRVQEFERVFDELSAKYGGNEVSKAIDELETIIGALPESGDTCNGDS